MLRFVTALSGIFTLLLDLGSYTVFAWQRRYVARENAIRSVRAFGLWGHKLGYFSCMLAFGQIINGIDPLSFLALVPAPVPMPAQFSLTIAILTGLAFLSGLAVFLSSTTVLASFENTPSSSQAAIKQWLSYYAAKWALICTVAFVVGGGIRFMELGTGIALGFACYIRFDYIARGYLVGLMGTVRAPHPLNGDVWTKYAPHKDCRSTPCEYSATPWKRRVSKCAGPHATDGC